HLDEVRSPNSPRPRVQGPVEGRNPFDEDRLGGRERLTDETGQGSLGVRLPDGQHDGGDVTHTGLAGPARPEIAGPTPRAGSAPRRIGCSLVRRAGAPPTSR